MRIVLLLLAASTHSAASTLWGAGLEALLIVAAAALPLPLPQQSQPLHQLLLLLLLLLLQLLSLAVHTLPSYVH